jgi:hypothetical protein
MKYYFISFMYGASEKELVNGITNEHPIEWQIECDRLYPGQYRLISWNEITKAEFEKYYEHLEVK